MKNLPIGRLYLFIASCIRKNWGVQNSDCYYFLQMKENLREYDKISCVLKLFFFQIYFGCWPI